MINIGESIRKPRRALDLTQEQLVDLFNNSAPFELRLSRNNLSKYETGDVMPPADKYLKLMSILRIAEEDTYEGGEREETERTVVSQGLSC